MLSPHFCVTGSKLALALYFVKGYQFQLELPKLYVGSKMTVSHRDDAATHTVVHSFLRTLKRTLET
jgi:hypothetical protein